MIVSSNWAFYVISAFLLVFNSTWRFVFESKLPWRERLREVSKSSKKDVLRGTVKLGIFWFILFFASFINVLHEDRASWQKSLQDTRQLQNENQQLRNDNKALDAQNHSLQNQLVGLTITESPNSLRRRTFRLVNELNTFWSSRPQPVQQPVQNPSTDEERQRNARWDKYWRDVATAYRNADFKEHILGIVREYKGKGVETGYLEQSAEQSERLIGAASFGGGLEDCSRFMNEICQLRELAYHVDANDQRIVLTAK